MSYAELCSKTCFSFLQGASRPGELIERAADLGLTALGICDRNGVYGIPKAYQAVRDLEKQGRQAPKLIVGAELALGQSEGTLASSGAHLVLLARDRPAYGLLCRILTQSHADKPKGLARLEWRELFELLERPGARGLIAIPKLGLPERRPGPEPRPASADPTSPVEVIPYGALKDVFCDRIFLPLSRFLDGKDRERTRHALELSARFGIPLIATNDVHYHIAERRMLQDALTSVREGVPLSRTGHRLFSNAERYLKSPAEMRELFRDLPETLTRTLEIAESCTFSPGELRYRYPSEWIPVGETAQSYLVRLVWKGAEWRYPTGVPDAVTQQIRAELALIEQLGYADYFLTIWEIVEFARQRKILCQGRGAAANSVVCYCLGITAVDPVRMGFLFERFISVERGEPPDIDVDFEHERREEVIQHIYEKYGRHRAAMVAAVITYRSKSCKRELSKALEIPLDAKFDDEATRKAHPQIELAEKLGEELYGFPRHLSIHSGGFTLSADPIIEIVPVEPARMEGRTIVQWDKDDLDSLGLLKVDILALGMLSAIRKTFDLIGNGPSGNKLTLATVPQEDSATYEMICRADTVGTFQIESRAQMSMLPRLLPRTYYDLVVQVAIVRPGPIVGKMVHPYLKRRKGLEDIYIPHPDLVPILERTLGVPLFQEQVMKMAITLAGFTPGEADQLRRAIGAWRSNGSVETVGKRLMQGLLASGLPEKYVQEVFEHIRGFAEYGFPESHAASFALIAYASSYLKCHYPAEFVCALINSQPMGFYSVHSLVDDAKRHGVRVLPVDPNRSEWECVLEEDRALRLGFRLVRGMSQAEADRLIEERRARGSYAGLSDFLARTELRRNVLHQLAHGDAFARFGIDSRHALWKILDYDLSSRPDPSTGQLNLFSLLECASPQAPLFAPVQEFAAIQADYQTYGATHRGHPMRILRGTSRQIPQQNSTQAKLTPAGKMISVAGLCIVRQRPPTAAGTTFATLEDEAGFFDLIMHAETYDKYRELFLEHAFLIARGVIQRDGNAVSMLVKELRPMLPELGADADSIPKAAGDYNPS